MRSFILLFLRKLKNVSEHSGTLNKRKAPIFLGLNLLLEWTGKGCKTINGAGGRHQIEQINSLNQASFSKSKINYALIYELILKSTLKVSAFLWADYTKTWRPGKGRSVEKRKSNPGPEVDSNPMRGRWNHQRNAKGPPKERLRNSQRNAKGTAK